MLNSVKNSLSNKILIVLFASVALVMAAVIYLTVFHQTKQMLREMASLSEELTMAIHAGIKYPMSVGDSSAVERQLLDIREGVSDVEVFVCDTDRKIVFSSHKERIKSDIGEYIYKKSILEGLGSAINSGAVLEDTFEEQGPAHMYLTHIHTVRNQEECFRCHSPQKKVLGTIIFRKITDRNYAAVANLRNTNLMISLLGICALIAVSHTLLVNLISKPIQNLAADIRTLPGKIADGGALVVPEITRGDEIGGLQDSFNQMAVELDEKTRAIEKSGAELAKANKELESFAYSVSHDLRAPLRNIDGFSKILLDEYSGTVDDKGKHYLKRVREGTTRMSMLIDDILAFSRIGRTELQLRPVNCRDVVNSALQYYMKDIETRGVSVKVEDIPPVTCDSSLLQSLFSNLISNALKFTRPVEKPEIVIGYDGGNNVLFVRDNGIGFDIQYHEKIFQVFQRLHLPEEYEGTGIGLAIVKRVAERHKGKVWAESRPGEGATFFIKLPFIKEA